MNDFETPQALELDNTLKELTTQIYSESDTKKTQDLVSLFNWNIAKKNVARIQKLNDLYDSVTDQMAERVEKRADQFSNSDLLDYVKVLQSAIDLNKKNLATIESEPPRIQNNTQINVNVVDSGAFDRESKERILAAIQATLQSAQQAQQMETQVNEPEAHIDNAIDELNSVVVGKENI